MATGEKIERKYLAHFIDVNFNSDPTASGVAFDWFRLGVDLEAFAEELNPQVDVRKNILGEQNVYHNGYAVQSNVDTFYAYEGDKLLEKLKDIADERATGTQCQTSRVNAWIHMNGSAIEVTDAWRENCWIVPQSVGGDTSGAQIPFQILNSGKRVAVNGSFSNGTWTFT